MKKTFCILAGVVALFFLGGIFWLEMEARSERIAAAKAAEAQAKMQAYAQAVQNRHDQLAQIYNDWDRQYELLHKDAQLLGLTNQAAEMWDEYSAAHDEAFKQLQATQLDLTVPLPSTKYIDWEVEIGLLIRQ
jgi:hypothetical protein